MNRNKRLQLAEAVCQELRCQITARITEQNWSPLVNMLHRWMRAVPKAVRYGRPQHNNRKQT